MNTAPELSRFIGETHAFAIQMMANAAYIQKELPNLEMPDSLRNQIVTLCDDLIGSKHDLIGKVTELEEIMCADPDSARIIRRVETIFGWIQDDVSSIHQCVQAVNDAVKTGAVDFIVAMLIMESATNILNTTPAWPTICDQSPEKDKEREITLKESDAHVAESTLIAGEEEQESAEPPQASALTPEEREELLAACRQLEAKRKAERQQEACEPESYEESDEDDEDEDNYDPNCYAFYCEDSYPVSILIAAIRPLMTRPELSAETMGELKVFLFAMQRLPLVTPGVSMSLGLRIDQGGESDWIEIRMEDGEFSLGRGSWIDGDADTETVFEVSSQYRDGDAFIAAGFAESFAECARDVCREVVIEDTSDEPFTGWNLEQDKKRWASLPCSFL